MKSGKFLLILTFEYLQQRRKMKPYKEERAEASGLENC